MGASRRILVVDDEPQVTQFLRTVLEKMGKFTVQEAHSGQEGLNKARSFQPHLILLDILMPELDGTEVTRQLKADTQLQHIPVIFLTAALTHDEVKDRDGQISGQPTLAKPVTIPSLLELIHQYIPEDPRTSTAGSLP